MKSLALAVSVSLPSSFSVACTLIQSLHLAHCTMIIYPFLEILMALVWDQALELFKSSAADFNVWPGLRTTVLDCRCFIFVYPWGLNQWSSNLNVHQNHLRSLLEHRLLGPSSEFLIQEV